MKFAFDECEVAQLRHIPMTDYTLHRNCYISFIESNRQRLNKIVESKKHTQTQKNNKYTGKKTIMKFDSGREHVRRMIGICWF